MNLSSLSHRAQESGGEFLSRVDGELVDTLFVGLGVVGVVVVDEDEVLLEDESPVGFFLRSPVHTVLSLPLIEGVDFGVGGGVIHCQDG